MQICSVFWFLIFEDEHNFPQTWALGNNSTLDFKQHFTAEIKWLINIWPWRKKAVHNFNLVTLIQVQFVINFYIKSSKQLEKCNTKKERLPWNLKLCESVSVPKNAGRGKKLKWESGTSTVSKANMFDIPGSSSCNIYWVFHRKSSILSKIPLMNMINYNCKVSGSQVLITLQDKWATIILEFGQQMRAANDWKRNN